MRIKSCITNEIIHSIIDSCIADKFITALCYLIQNLTIDNLHIIGDILTVVQERILL